VSSSYRIHEFAALAGVTVKALHHYDRLGLLKPSRTDAGYRVYVDADLERLEEIVALKSLGFSLKSAFQNSDNALVLSPLAWYGRACPMTSSMMRFGSAWRP
jgi:hypothetical protein